MSIEISKAKFDNPSKLYAYMNSILQAQYNSEKDPLANLSNTSATINQLLENINWVGFYLYRNGELVLGPFQGKVACTRIKLGNGVCGTAGSNMETVLVHNVHEFEGHIACDSASNSEIVIPLIVNNTLIGVLDIDSPLIGRFSEVDKIGLENVVRTIVSNIDFTKLVY
jgi:GAF domain-containing protein